MLPGQAGLWTFNSQDPDFERVFSAKKFTTRTSADSALQVYYSRLIGEGYLLAELDTQSRENTIYVTVVSGELFTIGRNVFSSNGTLFLNEEFRKRKLLSLSELPYQPEQVLQTMENSGYPFASVVLDSLAHSEKNYTAYWSVRSGPFIVIDSLVFLGNEKIPERYLRYYLQIRPGKPYSEERIISLNRKLQEISFLQVHKAPEVIFRDKKATVFFHLTKKKNNYFNGILGIRPNDVTGKINLTGDVEIKLQNSLNRAEEIQLIWKRLQPQTQDLFLQTKIPNIFGLPAGLDGNLNIYRRDSTFSTIKSGIGVSTIIGPGASVRGFYERFRSSKLGNTITASGIGNIENNIYGLGWQWEKLDYKLNPRSGVSCAAEFAIGQRTLKNNTEIAQSGGNRYNRIELQSENFIPTFKRQTIRLAGIAKQIFVQSPALNELYRIGGIRTIRGIDEESIFANRWGMISVEYRFLPDKNTALYVFADQGYYESNTSEMKIIDRPLGFGAGLNLKTGGGIFTFNYALGKQFDNPVLIRSAKISFGFRNVF